MIAKPSKSKKIYVYENIKKRIITNSLKPGDPLSEAILALEMKTSKTPIREAVGQLEKEGFVENIPGRGSFVSRFSFQDVRELNEMREILEGEVIRRVVARGEINLARAQEIRRKFAASKNNEAKTTKNYIDAGDLIHNFIFESFGNRRVAEEYKRLQEQISRIRFFLFNKVDEKRSGESYAEHLEIIDAIIEKDAPRAEAAMRTHLRNALEFLRGIF